MTITTRLTSEIHAAYRASDMALTDDLMVVEGVPVLEVRVTYFAVVMFSQLVLAKVP